VYADAQYNLGNSYLRGNGVKVESIKLYRLAAKQGYAGAQFLLSVLYVTGGVDKVAMGTVVR
jgi:uncharacterized protein